MIHMYWMKSGLVNIEYIQVVVMAVLLGYWRRCSGPEQCLQPRFVRISPRLNSNLLMPTLVWTRLSPELAILLQVKTVKENSVHLVLENGVMGVASVATATGGVAFEKGEEVICCVLDMAYEGSAQLIVTLNPKLTEKDTSDVTKTSSRKAQKAMQQLVSAAY